MAEPAKPVVELEPQGPALLLRVAAEQLTALRTVDEFGERLGAIVAERSERQFVVDFQGVTFMVTPAVNALLQANRQVKERGGRLAVCGLNANIQRVFTLMKLDRVLTIEPTREAALRRVGA